MSPDEHPKLRLYIDDAHATSWTGARGRGAALEHFAPDPRVVVALSLNQAFSAAGGALAVPSEAAPESPIFQLHCDSARMTHAIVNRMRDLGYYCCAVTFPAVPVNRPGIRFTICRHNLPEDIDAFVGALAQARGEIRAKLGRRDRVDANPSL